MSHAFHLLLLLWLSSLLACQSSEQVSSTEEKMTSEEVVQSDSMVSPNHLWMHTWNARSDSLATLYTENAVCIIPLNGLVLPGGIRYDLIPDYLLNQEHDQPVCSLI